jgi:hypothetical protein
MVSIEDQFDYVLLGHFGELPCKNVLEVQEVLQVLVVLIIAYDFECDGMLKFLLLCGGVSGDKAKAYILS